MSKTYKYKNITLNDLIIVGVGRVAGGDTIEVGHIVENPNLELVAPAKTKRTKEVNEEAQDVE